MLKLKEFNCENRIKTKARTLLGIDQLDKLIRISYAKIPIEQFDFAAAAKLFLEGKNKVRYVSSLFLQKLNARILAKSLDTTPTVGTTSRPKQPVSNVPPVTSDSDPLHGVKIPCFVIKSPELQETYLRAACHSAQQRLDHLYPFCIIDWHTKRSFLKTIFKKLYKNSGREKGTLRFFREKLNRRNGTVDDKHFEDCEKLFISVGKCFVIKALLEFFQMDDPRCKSTANGTHSVNVFNKAYRKTYIKDILDQFLDDFIFHDENKKVADGVWCYGVNTTKSFMVLADFKNAVSPGNGVIVGSRGSSLEVGYHSLTVNWNGGVGCNIEIDLFQQNRNCEMKKLIRSMGAYKTEKAIERASKASGDVSKFV
ncbi:Hypothetical predicted protein [Paramuricea clavata]|uniref:DUF6589 domain-containing protein n=1 Tax=Paramuricea clavata TaxID=317549 RepID=A0A6S7FXL9_PARCT|nr:Hypothetical predicted protein [Paramuricea clavata]